MSERIERRTAQKPYKQNSEDVYNYFPKSKIKK